MRRVITFILVFSVLAFALCVPAFADDSFYFSIVNCQTYIQGAWYDRDFSWEQYDDYNLLTVLNPDSRAYSGLTFTMNAPGYIRVDDGYYFNLYISFTESASPAGDIDSSKFDLTVNAQDIDGVTTVYNYEPTSLSVDGNTYTVVYSNRIGDGSAIRIQSIEFTAMLSSYLSGAYTVMVSTDISSEMTPEYKRHQELLALIEEVWGGVSDDIADQTEELTNGWENTGDQPADVGGASDSLADAENAALSGKSDSEIINEVASALESSDLPSQDLSSPISSMFDRLLDAFGTGYQSLLILALTLGLAAFLVGRSWAKGG